MVSKIRYEKTDESETVNGSLYPTFTQFREWYDAKVKKTSNLPTDVHAYFVGVVSLMVKTASETDISLMDDYTIQAWKLRSPIQENQFLRDPIVEAVFTQYFRDSVVTKSV